MDIQLDAAHSALAAAMLRIRPRRQQPVRIGAGAVDGLIQPQLNPSSGIRSQPDSWPAQPVNFLEGVAGNLKLCPAHRNRAPRSNLLRPGPFPPRSAPAPTAQPAPWRCRRAGRSARRRHPAAWFPPAGSAVFLSIPGPLQGQAVGDQRSGPGPGSAPPAGWERRYPGPVGLGRQGRAGGGALPQLVFQLREALRSLRESWKYCCTVEVGPPRSRRRASQRIRAGADERNTAINYNSRLRPWLEVVGGVKIAIGKNQRDGGRRHP